MESLRIQIINPKAKRLINNLAEMDLIRIQKQKAKSDFGELLDRLRNKEMIAPSLDEINAEVESARKSRHEKKA
jgi:hypothetical protein